MPVSPKRSIMLNIIIGIYFIISLVIGFSAILFGLKNAMSIDLVENIVVITLLLIFLILAIRWKKIGVYGVVAAHFIFIISCIFESRSSILTGVGLLYFIFYIITLIIPVLFFIYCRKQWENFK
ncbi:hypothetical protein HBE96_25360 [Clostridium sp. P21]|uniref:Uncharacterized protein n=1 Tax=Clostridium muellerianum TaxID=2716538 RepID=A0A7Y0HQB0_9CLOT|nr:hypothetical protein [Clostridium muellerianum]NMM65909.1 hypothetical protein [Clostridium muellerianum]